MSLEEIKNAAAEDRELLAIQNALLTGKWYDNPLLTSYRKFEHELSNINGIILKGNKIMLPQTLHKKALQIVHEGHLGIEKCKSLVRQKVYWKSLEKDLTDFITKCVPCQANTKSVNPEPIRMSELSNHPWEEVVLDFYGPLPSGESLLVVMDSYSRYPFVEKMKVTNAVKVINKLESLFSCFGYPYRIRSDNGSPFQSEAIKEYFTHHDIKHIKVTPRYPQANGMIERFMQVIGKATKTSHFNGQSWKVGLKNMLFNYRNASHKITGLSPAKLFLNRDLKGKLPSLYEPKSIHDQIARSNQQNSYNKAKSYFDNKHKTKHIEDIIDQVILEVGPPER